MSLKWKELELVLEQIAPKVIGGGLQKIQQTKKFGFGDSFIFAGFGEKGSWRLWASLYQDHGLLAFLPESAKPDSAPKPTTFVMVLRKHLLGNVIRAIEQVPQERIVILHFNSGHALVFELFPKRANLILLENWSREDRAGRAVGSFRQISLESGAIYKLPPAPNNMEPQVRDEFLAVNDISATVANHYLSKLWDSSFVIEKRQWRQSVRSVEKKMKTAVKNSEEDLAKAQDADRFQRWGKILFSQLYVLGAKKFPTKKEMEILGEKITLDVSKSFSENSEQMFKKSKKFSRAVDELSARLAELREKLSALEELGVAVDSVNDGAELGALKSRFLELGVPVPQAKAEPGTKVEAKDFLEVQSSDGFKILCGRNRDENRRVTYQESKGNDLWFHVKGISGAHVVVKAQRDKTAPLQTLLEAAQLALYYSKIREGKRAEVDYTYRKNVKPIKGTVADVTYTGNKTLYVEADAKVIRELVGRK